ncbi:hypothetical protein DFP73DRAFT_598597 [Morchella snyderi]|nr:hypothetical protein DFP73DRAFT_598597 [Morchella snyderi]
MVAHHASSDSVFVFRESQPTGRPFSPGAQGAAVSAYTTFVAAPIYTQTAYNYSVSGIMGEDGGSGIDGRPLSPIVIAGLATGGAIAIVAAISMGILLYCRRRRIGRRRQNSINGLDSSKFGNSMTSPCNLEPNTNDSKEIPLSQKPPVLPALSLQPSSLKSSNHICRNNSCKSRKNKHITWKDQVFCDQTFMNLPPHPASFVQPSRTRSVLRIGAAAQIHDPSDDDILERPSPPCYRTSLRSFSSPTLGADRASIYSSYSSIPPSPVFISALSPLPPYLLPTSHYQHHKLQRSPVPPSRFDSVISTNELNEYHGTVTCTSVYSFLPGVGSRRSFSDSYTVQDVKGVPLAHPPRPLIRYSGTLQSFQGPWCCPTAPIPSLPKNNYNARWRFSSVTEDDDGASISSVSSTSSSILEYSNHSTPRKVGRGGLRIDSSLGHSCDDLPPSGLTSPSHRKNTNGGEPDTKTVPVETSDLSIASKPLGRKIGILLSPLITRSTSLSASTSSSSVDVSESAYQDVFLDAPDIDTKSPTIQEMSARHFSCSLPTRPRFVISDPFQPAYPQVIPPTPTRTAFSHSEYDFPLQSNVGLLISECNDIVDLPPADSLRKMHESTYSPTLSMVNFYSMDTHAENNFSPVGFFSGKARGRSSSSIMSSVVGRYQNQDDYGDHQPPTAMMSPNPRSIFETGGREMSMVTVDNSMWRRYSNRFSSITDGYLTVDEGVRDREWDQETDRRRQMFRSTTSID